MLSSFRRRLGAALTVAAMTAVAIPALAGVAMADPSAPYTECPAVGNASSCGVLLVFESDGSVHILSNTSASGNPYDGADDTLVGVENDSGATIPDVVLSAQTDLFGFDGDGMCSGSFTGTPAGCPFDSTRYGGPGITYTNINAAKAQGTVNFAESCTGDTAASCTSTPSGLTAGSSAFFSLETDLSGASITIPKASPVIQSTTPSPSTAVGGGISDSAVLAGGRVPGGTLTFTLYGPGDTNCQTPISTLTKTVSGNGTYDSGAVTATAIGTYRWVVAYSGDANNNAAGPTACGSETVSVTPQTMTGRGFGLSAAASALGVQLVAIAPTPDTGSVSTTSAGTVAPPCVASLSGLVTASVLCAKVVTSLNPSESTTTASVDSTKIGIAGLPVITVGAVQSESQTTCGGSSGTTTIAYLAVGGTVVISKPTPIQPNTRLSVLGITLTLNEQTLVTGGLTVNAVHLSVSGAVALDVVLASSTSDIHNCP